MDQTEDLPQFNSKQTSMAHKMFLKGDGFDRKSWLDEIHSAYLENPRSAKTPLSGLCHQIGALDEDLDREQIWLHPSGGIRGVTVWRRDGAVELSLPTGCTKADYELAWDLMRMGVKQGAIAGDEEKETLDFSERQIERITEKHRMFGWATIIGIIDQNGNSTLPVAGFLNLEISPADAANGAEKLEEILVERMERYSNAFFASVMEIKMEQDGSVRTVSNYGFIPSMIEKEVELISTWGNDGAFCEDPIPAAHFVGVLQDRVEDLGSWHYVPSIDLTAEPDLADRLKNFPAWKRTSGTSAKRPETDLGDDMNLWSPVINFFLMLGLQLSDYEPEHAVERLRRFEEILRDPGSTPIPAIRDIVERVRGSAAAGEIDDGVHADFLTAMENSGGGINMFIALRRSLNSADFPRELAGGIIEGIRYLTKELTEVRAPGVTAPLSEKVRGVVTFVDSCVKPESIFG